MPISIRSLARIAVVALLMLSARVPGAAAKDQEKHDDIRLLLQTTGSLSNAQKMIDLTMPMMITNFKKVNPKIPQEVWDELQKKGSEEFRTSLKELEEPLIAIYDSNYTADEIKQLLAFYQSPLGRKMVTQTPVILQESVAIGQVWGEKVGRRIAEDIRHEAKAKGYDL